ncbi:phosphocarrier protein [Halohasta litchfieldiae]|jgi:phosphocarrier protein|uniref:Phosphocarrier protein HPr n=1 Tax=Halohasta litchfieldiae TaxID=1073996 RepID=A0A1H6XFJ3_9EURY|nr:HPr family phosphocarrier protein [Halohasta litchfieldiae]ATW89001.1 phosphocarrier protein [Halohasta litchfieldiae]SEJ27863.1 Phosphocarrier protein HPr [Halohasta litchfieldiae]
MERTLTVVPDDGLHARPAATFVETAGGFDANITVEAVEGNRPAVSADSMLGVTGLGVRGGDEVRLVATGPDAEAALDALEAILSMPEDELDEAGGTR